MNTNKKMMRAASIVAFVSTFAYFLLAAYAFSLGRATYWLWFVMALISLYTGLGTSSLIHSLPLAGKKKTAFLIVAILSFVSPVSMLLNMLAYFRKKDDQYLVVPNPRYLEKPKISKAKKVWFRSPSFIATCVGVGTVALASFSAMCFETNGFSVSVKDFTLTKTMTEKYGSVSLNGQTDVIERDGLRFGVTQYVPKTASIVNKAPVIFVMPGFTRTKATMAQYAIEFSKRGAVVFTIDPGCQGNTTYAGYQYNSEGYLIRDEEGKPAHISSTVGANGLQYLIHYVYANNDEYPYIDRERIGAIGHSAGGGNVVTAAAHFAGSTYSQSIIKSLYISGYIKTSAANNYSKLRCNAVNSYAYYDEGAFRYQSDVTAPEVINLRFINEVNGINNGYDEVMVDKEYGSMTDGTYRRVHREKINHCFEMYDKTSIVNSISFFRRSLKMETSLIDYSLTWFGKEGSNGIALAGSFIFLIGLSGTLLSLPFVKKIRGKKIERINDAYEYIEEEAVERKVSDEQITKRSAIPSRFSFTGKSIFWSTTILSAIIACLDYIPLAYLSMLLFSDAASNTYTFFFPARMFNAVLLWAAVNGIIGLALFFGVVLLENLIERFVAKKEGRKPNYDWSKFKPLRIGIADLLKTFLLSLVLFASFFFLAQLSYWVFHQDFRFTLISASPINARFLVTWLMYVPFIFLFYISNSIKVNCSIGMEGWKEWQVYLVGALSNSTGLIFIIIINYVAFFKTGIPYYGYWGNDNREVWLYINMVFGLIPMMTLLPILNRLFYKQTNRVYLGAFVNVMIFVMMGLGATVSYIPM